MTRGEYSRWVACEFLSTCGGFESLDVVKDYYMDNFILDNEYNPDERFCVIF